MAEGIYGTIEGVPITDEVVERLVRNAEEGFRGVQARRAVGRPAMGAGAATTVAVRLDPDLHRALADRVHQEHSSSSAVLREALRQYLI